MIMNFNASNEEEKFPNKRENKKIIDIKSY